MLPEGSRCLGCRYVLAGVAAKRCPECGRAFDAGDPSTVLMPGALSRWRRRAMSPPGPMMLSGAALGALLIVVAFATPGGSYFPLDIFGALACGLVALMWVLRLGIAAAEAKRSGCFRTHVRGKWKRWAVVPGVLFLAVVVSDLRLIGHLRMRAARRELERVAGLMLNPPAGWAAPQRVDAPLLRVWHPQLESGVVMFNVRGPGFLETLMLIYVPEGRGGADIPVRLRGARPFQGRWHVAWEDF